VDNYAPNYSEPFKIPYILNVTAHSQVIFNCSVPLTNVTLWTLTQIDPLTGENIQYFNLTQNPTANKTSILISNGTLKYGLYKFFFNFTLITTDETVDPFVATVTHYIKVVPTGFIVSGYPLPFLSMPTTDYTLGPFDSVSLIPAFYSYDADFLVNRKTLYYKFYCMLADIVPTANSNNTNITTDLYWMNPNGELTEEQINSDDTCFRSSGKISNFEATILKKNKNFLLNLDLFYFDPSGNSFSISNGFQYQYEGKYYKIFVSTYIPLTKKYANITYNFNVVFPPGDIPVVALLYVEKIKYLNLILLITIFSLSCRVTRFCAPFPLYKKITKEDQIVMKGNCVRGCPNAHMTYYNFKIYKNELDFNFEYGAIVWQELNLTENYFLGNIL